MIEKNGLEAFMAYIDKIISGELIVPSKYDPSDEESKELLSLAQLLAKVDYSTETRGGMERIWAKIHKKGELEDDELDMVAGGVNLNAILGQEDK